MNDTIFEVEHHPGRELVLRFKLPRFRRLPASTRQHLWAARKETLLALRNVLDKAIERTEGRGETKGKKRTKIEVQ